MDKRGGLYIAAFLIIFASSLLSVVKCRNKFQVCVVDGKGAFRKAAQYCPILDGPESKVECVIGLDRLDCLRRISKGKADFAVFDPEDLVIASNLRVEVLVTNEMRFTNNDFEYEVVAIVNDEAGIKNRYDLRGKNLCHPGYGYEAEWTQILSNYLEISVVPQNCNPLLTLTENRIKSSSIYFKSACKAGNWVKDHDEDNKLKSKYRNLCSLCNTPRACSSDDKYWGRSGPLLCLTDGPGDISWARLDDARLHFGLTPGNKLSDPAGFSYLCPNGTTVPLNSTSSPCSWVAKPWPVIAAKRTIAQEVQQFISTMTHSDVSTWKSALLNLIETYHLAIKKLEPIEAIESYLSRPGGYLNANSYPSCHPPRTVRICTTSNLENSKCSWLREAATVYGIEPDVECLKADNKTHCMQGIVDKQVDVVMVSPDMVPLAERNYNLKTLFYETSLDRDNYVTVAVIKKNSGIKSFDDLKGKKACFPIHDGVAWNSIANLFNKRGLLTQCPFEYGVAAFFGKSCVPGLPQNGNASLEALCKGDITSGDFGAMRCLTQMGADVAFVSRGNFEDFFLDFNMDKRKRDVVRQDYEVLCEGGRKDCHVSWAPLGHAMIRANTSDLWHKDALDVFLQMDNLFGKDYETVSNAFTLYGLFDGQADVLFHDKTAKLKSVPYLKSMTKMSREYGELRKQMKKCTAKSGSHEIRSNLYVVAMVCLYFIVRV